jgi:hypothetical protein
VLLRFGEYELGLGAEGREQRTYLRTELRKLLVQHVQHLAVGVARDTLLVFWNLPIAGDGCVGFEITDEFVVSLVPAPREREDAGNVAFQAGADMFPVRRSSDTRSNLPKVC